MAPSPANSNPEIDDTADLLEQARNGHPGAMDRLFERHVPLLRRWAAGRLPRWARDAADTSDMVQETVVQTLKHLDSFEHRGHGALQAYLRQAVINRVRNAVKRASGRPAPVELDLQLSDDRTSPLEALIGCERLEQYDTALGRLTIDERDAVVGRLELGLSYAELARELGRSSSDAARMAVVRAIAKLVAEMKRS